MIPNTNLKNIMTKTQTTDFFLACKESRIENNTSFYGCFYLGPFDDSLSQTLANDLRRTLLSELTGLAITSIEIEGILHKFSSLPGMKESVLDLICNLQSIVLSTNITLRSTKKTYTGFLNVSGPGVIKAIDLKLPAGLQCVDPNQYIATLAEDGFLNMKFNINEGKNFIKQKPHNLDVSILKKRNILLQNFKLKTLQVTPVKNIISNPISLDAVFMPVTKINCIIEENNIYSDFSNNQTLDSDLPLRPKSNLLSNMKSNISSPYCDFESFLNAMDYNSIYQTCFVLQKNNNKEKNVGLYENHLKLIPWQSNSLYFDVIQKTKNDKNSYRLWLSKEHSSFSKIKTFLASEKEPNLLKQKKVVSAYVKTFLTKEKNANGINQQNMYLEYAKNLKLKPLRKKSHLIVEIWTNGSIHPRQALYQSFIFLSNNFLKLQTVKMLGSMFKSEFAYGNLKYSILNNYSSSKADDKTSDFISSSFAFGKVNLYSQASLKAPIGILKISLRAYTALKKSGIFTLNDLVKYSKNDLLTIKNLGRKSLVEIETSLSYLGLTLKMSIFEETK